MAEPKGRCGLRSSVTTVTLAELRHERRHSVGEWPDVGDSARLGTVPVTRLRVQFGDELVVVGGRVEPSARVVRASEGACHPRASHFLRQIARLFTCAVSDSVRAAKSERDDHRRQVSASALASGLR